MPFFKKKQYTGPQLGEVSETLEKRSEYLDKKISNIERELATIKHQMRGMKGSRLQFLKKKAIRLLRQRKMYENQQNVLYSQQANLDNTAFAIETAQSNYQQLRAMKQASKTLRKQQKRLNIDKIENLHDELRDLMDDGEEIADIMSRSYTTPDDIDEDELLEELNEIEDEMLVENTTSESYLAELDVPSSTVNQNQEEVPQNQNQLQMT